MSPTPYSPQAMSALASNDILATPMQRAMVFAHGSTPGAGIYFQQMVWHLEAEVELPRLRKAWERAVSRFDALRSHFVWGPDGTLLQRIEPEATFSWRVVDHEPPSVTVETVLREDRDGGFPSGRPPCRWTVLRSAKQTVLVWSYHHALLDGPSRRRILEAVLDDYDGIVLEQAQPEVSTAELTTSITSRGVAADRSFWTRFLSGWDGPTRLPITRTDRTFTDIQPSDFLEARLALSGRDSDGIRGLAERLDCSTNAIIMAAWSVLLARYSDTHDVSFGLTRSGRRSVSNTVQKAVGMAINTTPFRVAVPNDASLEEFLREIRGITKQTGPFELTPAREIKAWVGLPDDRPLFESVLVLNPFQSVSPERLKTPRWRNRGFDLLERTEVPLLLQAYAEDLFRFKLEYHRTSFSSESAERVLLHLEAILRSFVTSPEQRLCDVSLLGVAEKDVLLQGGSGRQTPSHPKKNVAEAIRAKAMRVSDRTAVLHGTTSLSYSELIRGADQVAVSLRAAGIKKGQAVGVHLGRGPELVMVVLGTLSVGGVYVPLDPTHPEPRTRRIAEDAGLAALITDEHLTGPSGAHVPVFSPRDLLAGSESDQDLVVEIEEVTSSDPAYIMFTSGSTGTPKGVVVTHGNVLNLFLGLDEVVPVGVGDTWLAVTSVAFDISVLELLWTLSKGCRVVVHGGPERGLGQRVKTGIAVTSALTGSLASNVCRLVAAGGEEAWSSIWCIGDSRRDNELLAGALLGATDAVPIRGTFRSSRMDLWSGAAWSGGDASLRRLRPGRTAADYSPPEGVSGGPGAGVGWAEARSGRECDAIGAAGYGLLLRVGAYSDATISSSIKRYRRAWRGEGHGGRPWVSLLLPVEPISNGVGNREDLPRMMQKAEAWGADEVLMPVEWVVSDEPKSLLPEVGHGDRPQSDAAEQGGSFVGILDQIRTHSVTHLQCTPSLIALLMREPDAIDTLRSLSCLLLGGEALPIDVAQGLKSAGIPLLINMYGPTETTVWSTAWIVPDHPKYIRLGTPLANTQLRVLDSEGRMVPVGVPGELHIGGRGVALGYHNRPEQTRERFWTQGGQRYYGTGDLVSWDGEGQLEFLGRLDRQLKVQGLRIEPGEIETVLRSHPEVFDGAVLAGASPEGQELSAFFVRGGDGPDVSSLRDYLSTRLPRGMVPSRFVAVPRLPLTPNGKLDRTALLSQLANESSGNGAEEDRPETTPSLLGEVVGIWSETLGSAAIEPEENFFDLGGNSISAVRLVQRIQDRFAVDFSLKTLFEHATPQAMANAVDTLLLDHPDTAELEALLKSVEALDVREANALLLTPGSLLAPGSDLLEGEDR